MRIFQRILLAGLCIAPQVAAGQCGGEERWWVKMGADAGAGGLGSQTPIATTLHDLVRLPRPALPSDDETRVAAEKEVRTIDAFLVKFKKESGKTGDQDYHLVIADETLLFSKGGRRNCGVPTQRDRRGSGSGVRVGEEANGDEPQPPRHAARAGPERI